jgi:parallel beta-helix repeat protein
MRRLLSAVVVALLVVCTLLVTFRIQPTKSSPGTIMVPDDYPTIQEAVNAANPNDTVYVRPGTYNETVAINKTISPIGLDRNNTIIDGIGAGGPIIFIGADRTNVSNFSIQNSSYRLCGIRVSNSDHCNITDNVIRNVGCGIEFITSNDNLASGNLIYNTNENLDGAGGLEITCNSQRNLVTNNTFVNCCGTGISIAGPWFSGSGYYDAVTNNRIFGGSCGVWDNTGFRNTISNNTLMNVEARAARFIKTHT